MRRVARPSPCAWPGESGSSRSPAVPRGVWVSLELSSAITSKPPAVLGDWGIVRQVVSCGARQRIRHLPCRWLRARVALVLKDVKPALQNVMSTCPGNRNRCSGSLEGALPPTRLPVGPEIQFPRQLEHIK